MEPILGQSPTANDLIKDGSDATFASDVIEASMTTPVIVAFGLPQSPQSQETDKILATLTGQAGGAVKLVKINIERDPQIAQQLQIQGVPTVLAFAAGRPVDGFTGVQTEAQIKDFIGRVTGQQLGPSPADELIAQGRALLQQGQADQAFAAFQHVLQAEPDNLSAFAGLVQAMIAMGHLADAREIIDKLPYEARSDVDIAAAIAALELAEQAGSGSDLATLERTVAESPADHQARLDLAVALAAGGRKDEAVDHLLISFKADRNWHEGAAKAQLLKLFEAWGPADPATVAGRRKLSTLLFS